MHYLAVNNENYKRNKNLIDRQVYAIKYNVMQVIILPCVIMSSILIPH